MKAFILVLVIILLHKCTPIERKQECLQIACDYDNSGMLIKTIEKNQHGVITNETHCRRNYKCVI
jgi:hypothetical protein